MLMIKKGAVNLLDALIKTGVHSMNEKVRIEHEGKPMEITIKFIEVVFDDLESLAIQNEADDLYEKGNSDSALLLIITKTTQSGRSTPELMMKMADILVELGRKSEGLGYLDILYEQMPDCPGLTEKVRFLRQIPMD